MNTNPLRRILTGNLLSVALGAAVLLAPYAAYAIAPSDPYADAVYSTSGGVTANNAQNAVGAPDGTTATMASVNGSLTLDMGAGEEGTGTLRAHFGNLTLGANIRVDFLNENLGTITSSQSTLTAEVGVSTKDFAFDFNAFDVPYRYVRLTSLADGVFGLDAVQALSYGDAPSRTATPSRSPGASATVTPGSSTSPGASVTPGSGAGDVASGSMGFLENLYAKLKDHGFCWESLLLALVILIIASVSFKDALKRMSGAGKFLWTLVYLLGALLFCLMSLMWSLVWTIGFPLLALLYYLSTRKSNPVNPNPVPPPSVTPPPAL